MYPRNSGPHFVRIWAVCATAALLTPIAAARSDKPNVPTVASPLTDEGLALGGLVVELALDETAYRDLKSRSDIVIAGFRAAPQTRFDLRLERFSVVTPESRFVRDGNIRVAAPDGGRLAYGRDDATLVMAYSPFQSPPCVACHVNCDGVINAFDIEPFIDLLFGTGTRCSPCAGDANGCGTVDAFDIEPFLRCLFP